MITVVIIPAFLMGLASSLHCIGMCGPLSLAMPVAGLSKSQKTINAACYQAGRILTYTGLGALTGMLGKAFFPGEYQQTFSILAGLMIVITAVGYYAGRKAGRLSLLNGFYQFLSRLLFKLISKAQRPGGALLFGMANGLLPCGMVYLAAMASLASGSAGQSVLFMMVFGVGTLPAMVLVMTAGRLINRSRYPWVGRMAPVMITLAGLLLIVRGLNLGIPYLSPSTGPDLAGEISCHN